MAPVPVLQAELALEIDAPGVIGCRGAGKRLRRGRRVLALLLQAAEAAALEDVAHRACAGPFDLRVTLEEDLAQLPRSPPRHGLAGLDHKVLDLSRDGMRIG